MHIYIIISAIMILCAIAGSLIFGVEVAIEFKGGTILSYSYTGDVDTAQVETLAKGILNTPVTIQTGEALGDGSGKTMTISFSCAEGSFTPEVQGQLTTSIQGKFPDNQIELLESNDVSPHLRQAVLLQVPGGSSGGFRDSDYLHRTAVQAHQRLVCRHVRNSRPGA